jgi:hypothetical protein
MAADLIDPETRSGLDNLADQMIQQDFSRACGARWAASADARLS